MASTHAYLLAGKFGMEFARQAFAQASALGYRQERVLVALIIAKAPTLQAKTVLESA